MANRSRSSQWISPLSSFLLPQGGDSLWYTLALLSLLSLLLHHLSLSSASPPPPSPHFEGFGDELDEIDDSEPPIQLTDLPPSPSLTQSDSQTHHGPPEAQSQPSDHHSPPSAKPSTAQFDFWDEDEFEGIPTELPPEIPEIAPDATAAFDAEEAAEKPKDTDSGGATVKNGAVFKPSKWVVEIICGSFLIMFVINYFTGKKENENLALAWAARFATKDSIFEKNFSLLGVGEGDDSPLLLKEGQNVFKFYASGRRYCQGLLATMELKSRHDLISRIYNTLVPCKDEITFEVYMNDEAMDQVVFAVAKKKVGKTMLKELPDLQRFAGLVSAPGSRKWVSEELAVISESKEVAGDLITEAVLDQVFGEKAFEKYGKLFISMHFSDQQSGIHKKKLMFKFALPDANKMADMTRLVALVPYYIDLIGRYKLSSQARSKTDAARAKASQEAYKELQNARQEAIQRKKAERRKMMEEAEAKLSAEVIRKKEAKERARQMKKAMPKMKMTRA
uniref:Coiled-coil domain-containing protein 47 n=1 Tax=Opuntia streptacantha TaxID=393608 RepID=A0A7C8ZK73_OPUST